MHYRIAVDPQLNISAAELAAAWNAGSYAAGAPAAVDDMAGQTFLSPEITVALITAAVSIPTTVIATFISDYLKQKYIDPDSPKVTITTISTPAGEPVWIVKQEEVK